MTKCIFIGTSGWHYSDWLGLFYPPEITGYQELTFHAQHFNTVENNSSFYRIASEATYKTWYRMTPDNYRFSMKLNNFITHTNQLALTDEVQQKIQYILDSTQVLKDKLGAILIQLPASFKLDLEKLDIFLNYFSTEVRSRAYTFDIAIEFRNKFWLIDETYDLLRKHTVALVAGQSSRWPGIRHTTANVAYLRMHGPGKLFASEYSTTQLKEYAAYITSLPSEISRIYVYFNNDFHGYAIKNAEELSNMLGTAG